MRLDERFIMKTSVTVTLKIKTVTKVALDIYQAKQLGKTGKRLTNDEAIMKLLEIADPEAVEQARKSIEDRADVVAEE